MPLLADDQHIGVLVGAPSSAPGLDEALQGVRPVLAVLAGQAIEQKALAQELLDRYREINLLYRLHETIGGQIDLKEVAVRYEKKATEEPFPLANFIQTGLVDTQSFVY